MERVITKVREPIEVGNVHEAFAEKLQILQRTIDVSACIDGGCGDGFRLRKETMELRAYAKEKFKL
jgi:hypothetical protein